MKKFITAGLLFGLMFLMAGSAWALPIVAGDEVKMSVNNFSSYIQPSWYDVEPDTYNSTFFMKNDGSNPNWKYYNTFCLEKSVTFNETTIYTVDSISDYALSGGGPLHGAVDDMGGGLMGDKISDKTKWLYASYFSGAFSSISNVKNIAQNAIWYLEDEITNSYTWDTYFKTSFDNLNILPADLEAFLDPWEIKAANIVINGTTTESQSQLVGGYNPVPEPATMVLFGIGLLGIAGMGRKKTKK